MAAPDSNIDNEKAEQSRFACSDFLVADSSGMVAELKATMFEAIDSKAKRGETIMMGLKAAISAIAVHPTKPYLAVAQDDGWIGIYDYEDNFELKIFDDVTKKDKKSNEKPIHEKAVKLGDAKDVDRQRRLIQRANNVRAAALVHGKHPCPHGVARHGNLRGAARSARRRARARA